MHESPTLNVRPSPSPSFRLENSQLSIRQRSSHSIPKRIRFSSSQVNQKERQSPYQNLMYFNIPTKKSALLFKRTLIHEIKSRTITYCDDNTKIIVSKTQQLAPESMLDCEMKSDSTSHEERKKIKLLIPKYVQSSPTLFCPYPEVCEIERNASKSYTICDPKLQIKYKFGHCVRYSCIIAAFNAAGFVETEENDWNIYWSAPLRAESLKNFSKFQKSNHFPAAWQLGRKDNLWTNISR